MRKQRPLFDEVADWYHALAKQGWLAPTWPRQYGGMGLSPGKHIIYVEEWGRLGCPRIPDHGIGLVGPLLIQHGTEEQKAHYLPRILSGEDVWCQGYSEPNAGSDLASLRTEAVRDGDHFVVNGQKIWTTLAHCANWMFVLVRTDKTVKTRQRGITVLLLDLTDPGVRIRPITNLRGEADFCEVFFDNVRVPARTWSARSTTAGRSQNQCSVTSASSSARRRVRNMRWGGWRSWRKRRGAFDDPAFVSRYARLRLDVYDLGSGFERFANVLRAGGELGADVSMLKIFATELYQRITEEMLAVAGEEARFADDIDAGNDHIDAMNLFLDSRAPAIFGGSNEIQKNILAKAVLELPG